jgi:citrate synthase
VDNATYEEVVHLLLNNKLHTKIELHNLNLELYSKMRLPNLVVQRIKSASTDCHLMDILSTEFFHLGEFNPENDDISDNANKGRAIQIIAKVPTIISFLYRTRTKQHVVTPNKGLVYLKILCTCSEERLQINKKNVWNTI